MRIAVTGIGIVSPVGIGTDVAWQAIREGRSGIGEPTLFDPGDLPITVVGEVPDFDPTAVASSKEARRLDRNVLLAMAAAKEAVDEADLSGFDRERIGVLVGSAIGGFLTILEQHDIMRERGWSRVAPHFFPATLVDTASGAIATMLDLQGPNYAPCSACATGAHAIGEAAELLRRGGADAVVAGGVEACLHPLLLAGFTTMKGLGTARPGESIETASRPFDATRNGFVCSEGSTIVVLEPLDAALARGARIHGEVIGHGNSNDAFHVAAPHPESRGLIQMMSRGLASAGIEPDEVGYINAHGTSTPQGDAAETFAIKTIFGEHAYELAVSSTKGATGHQFGAAGAFETAMCILACRDGVLPPTLHYRDPDPECDLDYVIEGARETDLKVAMSNSIGLGGHNGCVVVRRYDS
ncbi:MAG: 3-oxoacyl-[acyl-carrier-protein] synthase [Gaiellales bacterium]|nr:3-oxoacyl-[acyl-carrier-protein] synthase [Gaiellales bacterium]